MADDTKSMPGQPGIAVDARGGAVIDPTKNVEDLVRALEAKLAELRITDQRYNDTRFAALEKMQDTARASVESFQNFARDSEARNIASTSAAETRRIDQLASTRQEFQNTIRDMLAESVRTTSSLVSTQLVQIQATFDARVTKLEQAQLTQAGRSSVADPAIEGAMSRLANSIQFIRDTQDATLSRFKTTQDEALSKISVALSNMEMTQSRSGGAQMGSRESFNRLLTIAIMVGTVAVPLMGLLGFFIHGLH